MHKVLVNCLEDYAWLGKRVSRLTDLSQHDLRSVDLAVKVQIKKKKKKKKSPTRQTQNYESLCRHLASVSLFILHMTKVNLYSAIIIIIGTDRPEQTDRTLQNMTSDQGLHYLPLMQQSFDRPTSKAG